MAITEFDLKIRYQIYRFFADRCRAPSHQELADLISAEQDPVRDSFHKLHERHMIFLEPGADTIRMANPFSAIPTKFRVQSGQKQWWANCAWDSLGIAAALNIDVHIKAGYPDNQETVELQVENGRVDGKKHVIYFPLPCRQWYDDLVFT
jgi:DNA-binding transcriptional MocR family regulator